MYLGTAIRQVNLTANLVLTRSHSVEIYLSTASRLLEIATIMLKLTKISVKVNLGMVRRPGEQARMLVLTNTLQTKVEAPKGAVKIFVEVEVRILD